MPRLVQQHPGNYTASQNISNDFENVVRYINAAELGDKTLGELMKILFNSSGEFAGPIEFRKDASAGLQYRVGTYTDASKGWITIASLSEIKGADGTNLGDIGAPIIHSRQDTTATNGQTVVEYAHADTDELLVYLDGVLQRPGASYDYTNDPDGGTNGSVTFVTPLAGGEIITIYKIRASSITGYTRTDTLTAATQTVFPFVHTAEQKLLVFKNGILQREGGANDYTADPDADTVTFTSSVASGNLVSIFTIEDVAQTVVTGLMLESQYVETGTGLIKYAKLSVDDDEIPTAKVNGLSASLTEKAKITASTTAPVSPSTKDLWLDTSTSPNQLKFFDGVAWNATSPESALPTFTTSDARKVARVNGTGTALEWADIDLSSVIAVTQKGAANGVATLDAAGRLPSTQLPTSVSRTTYYQENDAPANATYAIQRIFKQQIKIEGVALQTSSGTCDVQVAVNGVGVGDVHNVSSTPVEVTLASSIDVDATSASSLIGFIVTNNAAAADLEVTLAISIVST